MGGVNMIEIGKVISSNPGTINILLNSIDDFERNKSKIKISRYICIEDGNDLKILASIQNVSAVQSNDANIISYTTHCCCWINWIWKIMCCSKVVAEYHEN